MIGRILAFVRFSHTVFALPFALGSMLVAARGLPAVRTISLIVVAMIFARTAAMLFNRLADWEIDQRNPRTAGRHKLVSRSLAIALLAGSSGGFIVAAGLINSLCLALSPVALAIIFFYSLSKRFTSFSHFFLGLALAISPIGAWLAVRGEFSFAPFMLAVAVMLWVAGFDVIYATQDVDFDRRENLHSMVVRLGFQRSLAWAQRLHFAMLIGLVLFGVAAALRWPYFAALVSAAGALIYEHKCAATGDIVAINRAFFHSNAFVSAVFLIGVAAAI